MKRLIVMVVLSIALGVSVGTALPHPEAHTSVPDSGEPFLPAYLLMLQGKRPFLTDDVACPPARDLLTLIVPCDGVGQ